MGMVRKGLVVATVAGVLFAGAAGAHDKKAFDAAYKAAEAARKQAAAVGFEWRDTGKMLKQSKALAEKGKYTEAAKLADKARMQGEAGVMQAKRQETAWKAAVLR